jgi:hypothetical protein
MLGLLLVGDPLDLSNGVGGGPPPDLLPDIITTTLPDALVGVAYSQPVVVVSGDPPLTFSVTAGSLPAWASLNTSTGFITGTPSGSGTASFTVRVQDTDGDFDTQALSITTVTPDAPSGRRVRGAAGWRVIYRRT